MNSELQPDPNEETAALLRVLIHKVDNTTFGNSPPTLPQWTGPPPTIVQVQAILFASLAASLFSAFLAMLGKQWLNQYATTDVRGTVVERSQNRQRKLDGIVTWYFKPLMETPPMMLQAALLLLGYALSRYLWGVNITIASVVLAVTCSGVIFYIFIIIAGVASESCPYQTPGSLVLRYIRPRIPSIHPLVFCRIFFTRVVTFFGQSRTGQTIRWDVWNYHLHWSIGNILLFLKGVVYQLPCSLASDAYSLGRAVIWPLAKPLVHLVHQVHSRLHSASPTEEQSPDRQMAVLNFRCISWMLQTSLDNTVRLSALKHLSTTVMPHASFDPTLVTCCFNTFFSCATLDWSTRTVVIMQGLEELAMESALFFLAAVSHLLVVDPTSGVLKDIYQHSAHVFPIYLGFQGHQSFHHVNAACWLYALSQEPYGRFGWSNYKPSAHEHTIVAHNLLELTQIRYQRTQQTKENILASFYFVMHSLSLDPPPPTSVIVDCLMIIAIDLDCDISESGIMTLDERCVHL